MATEQTVDYKKIILSTLLKVCLIVFIVIVFNTWPYILKSLEGQTPPFKEWMDHSIKMSNVYVIVLAGAYFYFTGVSKAKHRIANPD